ncbi:hypothetical protein [Filimonas lacunae]|nr:hypothetical protein [Filimonas lacunae]BAV04339.1 hypothetical protein FLA_0327 [Filimonas lacunae]
MKTFHLNQLTVKCLLWATILPGFTTAFAQQRKPALTISPLALIDWGG